MSDLVLITGRFNYISRFSDLHHNSNTFIWICIIVRSLVWADTLNDVILIVGQSYIVVQRFSPTFQTYFVYLHCT